MVSFKPGDVIVLVEGMTDCGLFTGHSGVVCSIWCDVMYEVEFVDSVTGERVRILAQADQIKRSGQGDQ